MTCDECKQREATYHKLPDTKKKPGVGWCDTCYEVLCARVLRDQYREPDKRPEHF